MFLITTAARLQLLISKAGVSFPVCYDAIHTMALTVTKKVILNTCGDSLVSTQEKLKVID